ncbi:MAG: hypothetical protein WHV67_02195 [Thermoanaerobaculia bacterium]
MKKDIYIFAGHLGSGKSEIAINFALSQLKKGKEKPYIIDLDIIKPYFRSRMVRNLLISSGIEIILPEGDRLYADLPILMPQVKSLILQKDNFLIFDVAGDPEGARVLSIFSEDIKKRGYNFFIVINIKRPKTEDIEGNLKMLKEIEENSKLTVNGIISNTHLMDETTPEVVLEGYEMAKKISKARNLPIWKVVMTKKIAKRIPKNLIDTDILKIEQYLLPPHSLNRKIRSNILV